MAASGQNLVNVLMDQRNSALNQAANFAVLVQERDARIAELEEIIERYKTAGVKFESADE